jgi:alpha-beta hydrolase superfamily lysophospholipase
MSEAIPAGRIGPTYASRVEWRRQQALLPEELRLREGEEPVEEFVGWGGVLVHVDRYPSPEAPAKLILLHGGGGNGRLLAPFALMARRAGYEAVAPDLPGYGLTVVPDKRSLRYEDWNAFAADFVRAEHARDGRPVVLFGLSIGGLLAYEAAARTRVPAGVVGTCLLDPRRPEVRRGGAEALDGSAGRSSARARRDARGAGAGAGRLGEQSERHRQRSSPGARDLRRLPGLRQRDAGRVVPRLPERGAQRRARGLRRLPVFLAHPADDRWTPVGVSLPFFDRLGRVETRLVLVENAGHAPLERPGVDQLREALVGFMAASAKRAPVET